MDYTRIWRIKYYSAFKKRLLWRISKFNGNINELCDFFGLPSFIIRKSAERLLFDKIVFMFDGSYILNKKHKLRK